MQDVIMGRVARISFRAFNCVDYDHLVQPSIYSIFECSYATILPSHVTHTQWNILKGNAYHLCKGSYQYNLHHRPRLLLWLLGGRGDPSGTRSVQGDDILVSVARSIRSFVFTGTIGHRVEDTVRVAPSVSWETQDSVFALCD